jgi:hypothetical protein
VFVALIAPKTAMLFGDPLPLAYGDMLAAMRERVLGAKCNGGGWQPGRIPSLPLRVFFAVLIAAAMWGQKAEPLRIVLKDGVATIGGRLRGRQQIEYEAESGASKTITLRLAAAPATTVALKLYTPEGAEMLLHAVGTNRWTAELPKSGDYGISVLRTTPEPGSSTYKLTLTFR